MNEERFSKWTIFKVFAACLLLSIPLPLLIFHALCRACVYPYMILELPGAVATLIGMGGPHGGDHIQIIVGGTFGVLVNAACYTGLVLYFMERSARKRVSLSIK